MANFHFNAFPSGTVGALFSFRNIDGSSGYVKDFRVSILTEACQLKLALNIQSDSEFERRRENFLYQKCQTCIHYKSDQALMLDLLISDPGKFKRTVKNIKTAFDLVRARDNGCSGIYGFADSEKETCQKNYSISQYNANRLHALVDIPTLMMTCSLTTEDGENMALVPRASDLLALLSGQRAAGSKARWSLFRYWEPEPGSTKPNPLYKAFRLTNVYGDGRICWGENPNRYTSFKSALTSFWASRCNFDLHDSERDYEHGLKVAIESYECRPEGRAALTTLHKLGETIGRKGPCKGFVLTDSAAFTAAVPREKLVNFNFQNGLKPFFFGWVTSSKEGSHIIDCRGVLVEASSLSEDAVVKALAPTPKEVPKLVPQTTMDALQKKKKVFATPAKRPYDVTPGPTAVRPLQAEPVAEVVPVPSGIPSAAVNQPLNSNAPAPVITFDSIPDEALTPTLATQAERE